MQLLLLTLCGLLIGFIMISLGMGAALYIGCFITLFHLSDKTAAASALITTLPALLIGTFFYQRKKLVDFHQGNKLLIWTLGGTILGSIIVPFINQRYYQIIISIILIVLSLTILYKAWIAPHLPTKARQKDQHLDQATASFAGVISGIMTGLAGMSGGGPLVAGMLLLDAPVAVAAATSSYIRIWTAAAGIALHWNTMHIAWQPVIFMTLGTIIGAAIAPFVMEHFGKSQKSTFTHIMKPLIALILFYMGIKPFL